MKDEIRDELIDLLSEPIEEARRRERNEFDRRIAESKQLLLFGAGNLGRRVMSLIHKTGLDPLGFIDNNPSLWGKNIDGLEVFSPCEAASRFEASETGIVVTIWCGEARDSMSDRVEPLLTKGFTNIALFGHLAWKYPGLFLPHYALDLPSRVVEQSNRIIEAFELFQDRGSREIFLSHIRWRLLLDYDALPAPVKETMYFNEKMLQPSSAEVLIDGGAFNGDTIESFLQTFGKKGFQKIIAFEPDPLSYSTLSAYVSTLPLEVANKITIHPVALGSVSNKVFIESSGESSSRVGYGNHEVFSYALDDFIDEELEPSFIKLDIEGSEIDALEGGRRTITTKAPALSICTYHLQSHLWEIPLLIQSMQPDYHFFLAPHVADGWDLVLYAIPSHRCL